MTAADAAQKQQAAREKREQELVDYMKELADADSFDDLSDDEALRSIARDEL